MEENRGVPVHVSIIMDGNGRWAAERGKERICGHAAGAESVRACTEYAVEKGIRYLSLFAFSEENWGRPQAEVSGLMELMMKSIHDERATLIDNGVRIRFIGNRARLSDSLNAAMDELEEATKALDRLTLIVFVSYSGKWDIMQAATAMSREAAADPGRDFTEKDFEARLCTAGIPDPDLLIRTSGEQRISNYLLWQTAYSEFYFTRTLWPDFRKEEFQAALDEYARRDRRYGKVK